MKRDGTRKTKLQKALEKFEAELYTLEAGPRAYLVNERCELLKKELLKRRFSSIEEIRKVYNLPSIYLSWLESVLAGHEEKNLRPDSSAGLCLMNLDFSEIKLLELTTQDKKMIREYVSRTLSPTPFGVFIRPGESIKDLAKRACKERRQLLFKYRRLFKELDTLLAKNKNTRRRQRRIEVSTPKDATYATQTLYDDRRRQQKHRGKLRREKLLAIRK